jgi:hypothetical protein
MSRRDRVLSWLPIIGQAGGLMGCLIFVPLVWLLTGRIEQSLIVMFGSMASAGYAGEAWRDFVASRPQSEPRRPLEAASQEDE